MPFLPSPSPPSHLNLSAESPELQLRLLQGRQGVPGHSKACQPLLPWAREPLQHLKQTGRDSRAMRGKEAMQWGGKLRFSSNPPPPPIRRPLANHFMSAVMWERLTVVSSSFHKG